MVIPTEDHHRAQAAGPTLRAFQFVANLPGGSKSLLALGSGLDFWVVKFTTNPQHRRLVLTEYIATSIARRLGLASPRCGFIEVCSEVLLEAKDQLKIDPRFHTPGLHFASRYVLSTEPGSARFDLATDLQKVTNLREILGVFILDVWLGNEDHRQVVFAERKTDRAFQAWWIDWGECFGSGDWGRAEWRPRAQIAQEKLYKEFCDSAEFLRWIEQIEAFTSEDLVRIVQRIPASKKSGEVEALEQLIGRLVERRGRIRELVINAVARAVELRRNRQPRLEQQCLSPEFLAYHLMGELTSYDRWPSFSSSL